MKNGRKGLSSLAASDFVNSQIRTALRVGFNVVTLQPGRRVTPDQLVRAAIKRGLTAETNGMQVRLAKQREVQAEAA